MADIVHFSALNVHQNKQLNPYAPEYIPIVHNRCSSVFFYYHSLPAFAPLPHPSFYFRPVIHLPPPHAQQVNHIYHYHPQSQQQSEHLKVDQGKVIEKGSSSGPSRRWRNGGGRRAYEWKVKSRSSSSSSANAIRNRNRAASGKVAEEEDDDESNNWRMVKYKACKKVGMKFKIQPVEKSGDKTTVMIRNIPSRYTREMMLSFLDRHCMEVNGKLKQSGCLDDEGSSSFSAYDFFYMPMDFKTGLNKSYAFVNFTTPEAVWRFHTSCDNQKWELFESNKIRQIAFANLQGTKELIEHFGRTAFACATDEFLPVHFQPPRDGCADVNSVTSTIGKRVT